MTAESMPNRPRPCIGQSPPPVCPFIDRERELALLYGWERDRSGPSILTIVGLGGMGKTSLGWEWFNKVTGPQGRFQGALWWNFYEAGSDSFFPRCYAYLTGTALSDCALLSHHFLVERIVSYLQKETLLFVLDGLEREMVAFAPPDAVDVSQADTSHRIRRIASRAVAEFLKTCAHLNSGSKVLITSRFALADLEDSSGHPAQGTQVLELGGFDEVSTRSLLSQLGITEGMDGIVDLVAALGFHPMTTSLLARMARDRPTVVERMRSALDAAPSVADRQRRIKDVVGSVGTDARLVAARIAASHGPVSYSELAKNEVGPGRALARHSELDRALTQLQDLGLIGWNTKDNVYDMHPIVRGLLYQADAYDGRE